MNTNCFQPFDWGLTIVALLFAMFVKIISSITK